MNNETKQLIDTLSQLVKSSEYFIGSSSRPDSNGAGKKYDISRHLLEDDLSAARELLVKYKKNSAQAKPERRTSAELNDSKGTIGQMAWY